MKKNIFIVIFFSFSIYCLADDTHLIQKKPGIYEELSKFGMQNILRQTAKEYEKYGYVARSTNHDMAYPKDRDEYIKMNGFGILWITSHSQLKEELPLKNVRVIIENIGTIYLDSIYSFQSDEQDKLVSKVLGEYRSDAIYMIPFFEEVKGATLVADYSANRNGFIIASIDNSFPIEVGSPIRLPPVINYPDMRDIKSMLEREYPISKSLGLTFETPNESLKVARFTRWAPQISSP